MIVMHTRIWKPAVCQDFSASTRSLDIFYRDNSLLWGAVLCIVDRIATYNIIKFIFQTTESTCISSYHSTRCVCSLVLMPHTCNLSYLGGWDQEDRVSGQPGQTVHRTLSPK
jgi:hypothetical protein